MLRVAINDNIKEELKRMQAVVERSFALHKIEKEFFLIKVE